MRGQGQSATCCGLSSAARAVSAASMIMLWAVERSGGLCRRPACAAEHDLGVGSPQGSCPRLLGRLSAAKEVEQCSLWAVSAARSASERDSGSCRRRRVRHRACLWRLGRSSAAKEIASLPWAVSAARSAAERDQEKYPLGSCQPRRCAGRWAAREDQPGWSSVWAVSAAFAPSERDRGGL